MNLGFGIEVLGVTVLTLCLKFSSHSEPVLVVVSLAQNGCLLNHLQKSREHRYINVEKPVREINFDVNERVRIARDIANGMLHLSNKKVNNYNHDHVHDCYHHHHSRHLKFHFTSK